MQHCVNLTESLHTDQDSSLTSVLDSAADLTPHHPAILSRGNAERGGKAPHPCSGRGVGAFKGKFFGESGKDLNHEGTKDTKIKLKHDLTLD